MFSVVYTFFMVIERVPIPKAFLSYVTPIVMKQQIAYESVLYFGHPMQ